MLKQLRLALIHLRHIHTHRVNNLTLSLSDLIIHERITFPDDLNSPKLDHIKLLFVLAGGL